MLYGVETRIVNQAVKNNPLKFPKGYILELNEDESSVLRSKILTLEPKGGKGRHSKYNIKKIPSLDGSFTQKYLGFPSPVESHTQKCLNVSASAKSLSQKCLKFPSPAESHNQKCLNVPPVYKSLIFFNMKVSSVDKSPIFFNMNVPTQ
jgi:hypothetical protein